MALRIGSSTPTSLRLGSATVDRAYLGVSQVFGSTPPVAGATLMQGVYREQDGSGGGGDAGTVESYATWLGYPLDFAETFIDEPTGTPGGSAEGRWQGFTFPNWVTNGLTVNATGLTVMIGVGSFISSEKGRGGPTTLNLDGTRVGHDLVPTGAYDVWIKQQATNLLAHVQSGPIYVRLNHEFNIDQFGHRAMAGREADFVASWRHYVNTQRTIDTGRRIKYVWNPSLSSGTAETGWNVYTQSYQSVNIDACYPGDDYVDRIGPDCYDQGYWETGGVYYPTGQTTTVTRERNWRRKRTGTPTPTNVETQKDSGINCLNGIRDYALAGATRNGVTNCRAMPLSFPEVGLWYGNNGGGDNPYFVEQLAAFVKASTTANGGDVAFWEHANNGVFDTDSGPRGVDVPLARAAFLNARPWRVAGGAVPAAPNAPAIGTATAGNGSVTVAFTPAATGTAATSFTATVTPGGYTQTGSASPITVTGVPNGTAVTAKVKASNAGGSSVESAASNSVTPTPPAGTTVAWYSKAGSTVTRPVGTYYRAAITTAGNLEVESDQITVTGPSRTVTITVRQAVGTAKSGDMVANVLTSAGGYLGTVYPASSVFTPAASFTDVTRTFDLSGHPTAGKITIFVAIYNAVVNDAIELQPTIAVT